MKIDAEGHDVAVVRGASALIARCRPTILMGASGTAVERQLFDELSPHYRILRIAAIDDPFWCRDYLDAMPFYRQQGEGDAVNIGFIPLPC
ncbi:MAG TPA: FkbM family methyltransferase [Aliidongia sp.]|uniref:FkbM family methyltransferase n=1 Tax=Aliidongia sp. TaxID=1914230 RepID=UPI002DDD1CE4|nr:FkbM family methyltransferase [Aliidongia sp.]HEV2673287.1 FkbM family methyltransferase [Aliidongia sp.]